MCLTYSIISAARSLSSLGSGICRSTPNGPDAETPSPICPGHHQQLKRLHRTCLEAFYPKPRFCVSRVAGSGVVQCHCPITILSTSLELPLHAGLHPNGRSLSFPQVVYAWRGLQLGHWMITMPSRPSIMVHGSPTLQSCHWQWGTADSPVPGSNLLECCAITRPICCG